MFSKDIQNALVSLYAFSGIPFTIMSYTGERILDLPDELASFYRADAMQDPPKTLSTSEYPAGITLVEAGESMNSAIVKINDSCYAVTAPVPASSYGSLSGQDLRSLIRDDRINDYLAFIRKLPIISAYHLVAYASLIKFICTNQYPEGVNFYRMIDPYYLVSEKKKDNTHMVSRHIHSQADRLTIIKKIRSAVSCGDRSTMEQALRTSANIYHPLSADTLQQKKYVFILHLKEACDAAIQAGTDQELIIDCYENWCSSLDHMHTTTEIESYYYHCLMTLCDKVNDIQPLKHCSIYTKKAVQYIKSHLYEPMNNQTIADWIPVNRQVLSRTFFHDTGISLHQYITNEKLIEATALLKEDDLTILDISLILGFSSQSHFTDLFKQKYGTTPRQYRILIHNEPVSK